MISLLHLTLLALTAISVVEAYRIGQIGTQLNLEKLNFEKYRVSSNPLASESPSLRRFQSQLFADRQPDRRITRESENEFFESEVTNVVMTIKTTITH